MQQGLRDSRLMISTKFGAVLLGIAVQSSLAWLLGPEGRGAYAVCLLTSTLLSVVFSLGLDKASQYYMARDPKGDSSLLTSILGFGLIASVPAILLGFVLLESSFSFFTKAPRSAFQLSILAVPVVIPSLAMPWILMGQQRFRSFGWITLATLTLQLILTLSLVFALGWGVHGALVAVYSSNAVFVLLGLVVLSDKLRFRELHSHLNECRSLVGYGVKSYFSGLGDLASFRLGTILIAFFVMPEEIGFFAIAAGLVTQVQIISNSVFNVLLPRVSGSSDGRVSLAAQAARISLLLSTILLLAVAVFAVPLVRLLYSPSFLPSVSLLLWMIPGMTLWTGGKVLSAYLMGTNRPGLVSWSLVASLIVNLILLVLLLPRMGLVAAAWGMSAGLLVRALFCDLAFRKVTGMTFLQTWWFRKEDAQLLKDLLVFRLDGESE